MTAKQLALIPESLLKHQVLKAIDYERTPEDWSKDFHLPDGEKISFNDSKDNSLKGFLWYTPEKGACFLATDTLKPVRLWPAGTPTGDAIRLYLRRWGWIPQSEQGVTAPQESTRTII